MTEAVIVPCSVEVSGRNPRPMVVCGVKEGECVFLGGVTSWSLLFLLVSGRREVDATDNLRAETCVY